MADLNAEFSNELKMAFAMACLERDVTQKAAVAEALLDWIESRPERTGRRQRDNAADKNLPPELAELVEEFIRFATSPGIEDRIWSKHTLELLRERIAERKARREAAGPQGKE